MEAKDLMIGDWVCVTKNFTQKYHQIRALSNDEEDVLKGTYINDYGVECNSIFSRNDIQPIPLTKEILEKNGWVYNNEDEKFFPQTWVGGGLMLQGADDCGYCVVVTSDYDDEDTNSTPFIILYVHELQHALRLRRIEKEIIL